MIKSFTVKPANPGYARRSSPVYCSVPLKGKPHPHSPEGPWFCGEPAKLLILIDNRQESAYCTLHAGEYILQLSLELAEEF